MALKNQTQLLFAQQLEEMLKTMPMDKVRITELCKRCHTIPQTFYYHFHDKYELVAWTFLYDFSQVYVDQAPKYSVESIIVNLKQINQRRIFYQKTYNQHSQNSIDQYIQKFNIQSATEAVESFSGQAITPQQINNIKYHSYGMMGIFKEWIEDENCLTIEELAKFQYDHTPEFLREAYQAYRFKNSNVFL
ncbi:TetR/AcrR family transcriptional regulator C-terminal domain-containing protein [Companilactobacillus kimchiensis]|uniref:Transcriptional regulator, tetR family protein n=1 Tax=Companilactobacillus kimchiensis TaxID=993692 RepID=A0A0R2LGL4_9LACO|nr:TetR/AcrR family transcriptional regulator C-terminal domain-containing protein [Companilactobacillus kimchiensis]KRO00583.1 transcriptional regulator, tetR family protein [Companilactobacillus kimchiensis]